MSFKINTDIDRPTRYDFERFLPFDAVFTKHDSLDSQFILDVQSMSVSGRVSFRGDVQIPTISFDIFGSTQYWWILMIFNNKIDPVDFVAGEIIEFPSLNDLESSYFSLVSRRTA